MRHHPTLTLSATLGMYTHVPNSIEIWTLKPRRAIQEPGMQLHFLPLDEVHRHLTLRGCVILDEVPCDDYVSVPGHASTSHCIIFAKVPPNTR